MIDPPEELVLPVELELEAAAPPVGEAPKGPLPVVAVLFVTVVPFEMLVPLEKPVGLTRAAAWRVAVDVPHDTGAFVVVAVVTIPEGWKSEAMVA